jgi:hypothetical protein
MTLETTNIKQRFRCDECGVVRHHGNLVFGEVAQLPTKWRLIKATVVEFPAKETVWEFHVCEAGWPKWKERLDG